MPREKINVVQDEEKPVSKEMLATAICKMSDATNQLLLSGLNHDAIVVLLVDKTKMSKRSVRKVIDAMGQLRADYTHD